MKKLFLVVFLIATMVVPVYAEQFEKDGYIIDAVVTSECPGDICTVSVSGTVSGKSSCIILTVRIFAVDNNGKEVKISAGTSRSEGATPLSGKTSLKGAGSAWTIRSVETSCNCE
ncbi:hypothetical protein [Candidatus Magnetominusculus xianensis]|uniref:Secreted protein n=1 Tax=Candidatus Magnetominusculus xianensis TaxID=1748249 RepID=A0ABR5SDN5_9BACT|nr:hypothetical protein [Candidatus Magnetominusculus xianensis]KWT83429.1 hypothetical protein ASN18_2245 [Candidatus Magnetominusculus xianensis]MBF0403538.1 hypothetical protein [Nitrospirota bacterium]